MVGDYSYTALPAPGHIRLLTLKASKSKFADLHGELIDYPLHECEGDLHCYEALSYVWGDDKKTRYIWIGTNKLHITESLCTALLRLRNRSSDRSLWVDAICIDQTDDAEKSVQVQRMATIYSKASRVRVWLGRAADGSDEALDCLADAGAAEGDYDLSNNSVELIRQLLARDWFKRIWVLQEVAAAQHVVLMCGATSIDGYAFCMGLQVLHKSGKLPDLQNHTGSIVHLIRRSIFGVSKQNRQPSQEASPICSLNIQPLGQLIDMYRNRQATDQRDNVYALLGMCSDEIPKNLLPNYSDAMTWDKLLDTLARYVFGAAANIEIVATNTVAVRTRVKILGHISAVRPDDYRYDMQVLTTITSWNTDEHTYNESKWIVPTSAVPVQTEDLICLFEGGQNVAILRPETGFFRVITTSGRWRMRSQLYDRDPGKADEYNLLLLWDWNAGGETLPLFTESISTNSTSETDMDAIVGHRTFANALYSAYLDEKAELSLLNLERRYQQHPTGGILAKLDCSAKIVYICLRGGRWDEAERRYQDVYQHAKARIETKWLSESITQYLRLSPSMEPNKRRIWETLKSAMDENLGSPKFYIDIHRRLAYVFASDILANAKLLINLGEILVPSFETSGLLSSSQENGMVNTKSMMTAAEEDVVVAAAGNKCEVMELLFEKRGDQVPVTEDVVVAAAGNPYYGWELIKLLLQKRGDEVPITENVVMAAAGNAYDGRELMKLLFEERADQVPVTENMVVAAAGNVNYGRELMKLLLEKRGDEVPITENVVAAAAGNDHHGRELMKLLLEKRRDEAPITENVVAAAAGNPYYGRELIKLLLQKRGDEVPITENVVAAAAGNMNDGRELMELLLEKRGDEVLITENVVVAAAGSNAGPDVMELLLKKRGDQVVVTENVMKAAASNYDYGLEVIELLFEKRGDMATLSTAKFLASKGAAISGEPEEAKQLLLEKRMKDRDSWFSKVIEESQRESSMTGAD